MLSLLACGVACGGTADRSDEGAAEGALIGGGVPAMAQRQELKPVVYLGRCTATKVGPRHFLTAAHCILARVAPSHRSLGRRYPLRCRTTRTAPTSIALNASAGPSWSTFRSTSRGRRRAKFGACRTINRSVAAPSASRAQAQAYTGGASDVALVVMKDLAPPTQSGEVNHSVRDLPEIPVTTKALVAGEAVTLAGYGCSGDAAAPPSWLRNNILRIGATKVVDGNASVGAVSDDWKQLGARYLFTENVSSRALATREDRSSSNAAPLAAKRGPSRGFTRASPRRATTTSSPTGTRASTTARRFDRRTPIPARVHRYSFRWATLAASRRRHRSLLTGILTDPRRTRSQARLVEANEARQHREVDEEATRVAHGRRRGALRCHHPRTTTGRAARDATIAVPVARFRAGAHRHRVGDAQCRA